MLNAPILTGIVYLNRGNFLKLYGKKPYLFFMILPWTLPPLFWLYYGVKDENLLLQRIIKK